MWRLRVVDGTLALVAVHGTFPVRGMEPAVAREVATYPDGIEIEADGDYDGIGNIDGLVVTRIRGVLTPLVPLAHAATDDDVLRDPDLARARAAERLGDGDVEGAATDLAIALRGDAAAAEDVYARLPERERAGLVDDYARYVRSRSEWSCLRWLPLDTWSDGNLDHAIASALKRGGSFGTYRAEELIDELSMRGHDVTEAAKTLAKIRRAQAREGGTWFRITTPLQNADVVGATRDTVWIAGRLEVGPAPIVTRGAKRQPVRSMRPAVIAYDTEGNERARHIDVYADRVIDGIAIQRHARARHEPPCVRRLSDGAVLCTFQDPVVAYDHEYLIADGATHRIATGERVDGAPRETAEGEWMGWRCAGYSRTFRIGPSDGEVVTLKLQATSVLTLVPPWLAIERGDSPILIVALGEVMTCQQLRVDGKLIAKRG